MDPRFSGKVREKPQRREWKWGEKLRSQGFCDSPRQNQTSWLMRWKRKKASRAGWLGVVETPDGRAGVSSRNFGITATGLAVEKWNASEQGNTGSGEGGFNDQTLFENLRSMNGRATNDEALGQGGHRRAYFRRPVFGQR